MINSPKLLMRFRLNYKKIKEKLLKGELTAMKSSKRYNFK